MATLAEVAEWVAGIYQIETTDPVLGGPPNEATGDGMTNIPAQQLAKRTSWLRSILIDAGLGQELGRVVTNLNTITASGFYRAGTGATGSPDGTANIAVLHIPGHTTADAYQIAFRLGTANRVWVRRETSGTWSAWVELMTSGNTGTMAVQNANSVSITGGSISGITDLAVADGGTGASTAAQARANLGAQATITGAASSVVSNDLSANRAVVSDGDGKLQASPVTSTELGWLEGVTSSIQTQINNRQPLNANLTSISSRGTVAGRMLYTTAASTWAEAVITAFGRSLLDDDNAAAARTTLGLGNAATATLQTSQTDGAAGRVLTAGAFGLGGSPTVITSLNATLQTGFYQFAQGAAGAPDNSQDALLLHIAGPDQITQIVFANAQRLFIRNNDLTGLGFNAWTRFVPTDVTITAGNGLTGGGDLSNNRTLTLGTPASITSTSENTVTATSHTHALTSTTVRTLTAEGNTGQVGTYAFLRRATSGQPILKGEDFSGSALRYAGVIDASGDWRAQQELSDNTAPTGTWKAMGSIGALATQFSSTLFLRIA